MAAAPYKISLVVAYGSPTSAKRQVFSMTASDVADASWLFQSGASQSVLSGTENAYIVDAILSAAGTDTTQSEFFVNGTPTNFKLQNSTSIATTITRPLQQAPLGLKAGATLQVLQRA